MSRILSCLALLVPITLVRAADDAPAPSAPPNTAPPANTTPVLLEPMVVRDRLDKAREDIVPSLGAAQFQMDRIQIETQALGANAGFNDVLLHVPGVAEDSYGQVHLRGEHADLQYRINDVLLPEGLTGFGQELDTRFVETVSVLTGALPAQYGYRTAGVVDIHTRSATRTGGDASIYGGSFGTARANLEGTFAGDRINGYVTATAERTDLGVENPTPRRNAIHDRKEQEKAFAYVSGVIDETSRLNLMVSGSFARFQIPDNPGLAPQFSLAGSPLITSSQLDENQREENHYAILAYEKTVGDFSGQASVFTRYSLVAFAPDRAGDLIYNGVASRVHRSLTGNGTEADGKWAASDTHTLRGGVIVTSTNAGTRTTTSVFPTDSTGAQTSDVPFDVADNHRKLGWLGGVYAQDEWKPASSWTINYGLRADLSRAYRNEGQLSPRVNLVYQLSDATSIHAGYARYFTPPPVELVQTTSLQKFAGTTNAPAITTASPVRAERAHYFDAGISEKLTENLSATLDAYDKESSDQLDEGQFGQALIFSPFNYRRGRTYGVELAANYSRNGFSAYANVAISQATARRIVSGEFQFSDDELAYIAAHDVHADHDQRLTGSAGMSYRFADNVVFADLLYGSGLRRGFANTDHLPEYHPVNVGFEHTFKFGHHRELRARVDVVNVLDETYQLRDGSGIGVGAPQFGARRGVYGGVTWAF